jgi:sortase A
VFREGNSLLKVGLIMMALALVLVIAIAVVSATLRSEPERVVAAEVARRSPGEAPPNSSDEEGSATKKYSSEKDSPLYPSGKQEKGSLRYGSTSSSSNEESVEQRKEEAKEPQAVPQQEEAEPQNSESSMPQPGSQQTSPEAPSGPQPQPYSHQPKPLEQPLPGAEQGEAPSGPQSQPQQPQPYQQEKPLPGSEERGWPKPTQGELESANQERHYELLPGAIMGLTIEAMGIYDVPVFDSKSQWALAKGVAHHPQTSLPWSQSAQRNVYLAGHRMGYRGTWSRMIFYKLPKLKRGDEVVLKDRAGTSYRYRVSEVFVADPTDVWVMGQVRGRDMVTLQTCIPYPTFEKRLIVRADRV